MNIVDIKDNLHDINVLTVLSQSQYMPTEEKMNSLADRYEADNEIYVFAGTENGIVIGVIAIKHLSEHSYEITSIAVDNGHRGHGVGSALISAAVKKLHIEEICAETDDDAVNFYRKYGFEVNSLGEKYPGTVRYLCSLKLT